MRNARQRLGAWGEDLICHRLVRQGYTIIARNYRCKYGELDIVCMKDSCLYSIEVKTRRSHAFGFPEESILPSKRSRLMRATACFLRERKMNVPNVSIQVYAVSIMQERATLKIYTVSE